MMPGMDGMETLERIKTIAPELPVYREQEANRCFEAGVYDISRSRSISST